jgi:pimeloyl-ACP methyl ester carboxylesterase
LKPIEEKLVVPGIWFNPKGQLARKIESEGYSVFGGLLGLDSQQERVERLVQYLRENRRIATLIGHSAGCVTIIEALRDGCVLDQVNKVVLMNSGPLPGTMFSLLDPTTRVTMHHIGDLAKGRPFCLSEADAKYLLGEDTDMEDLAPDSGIFIRSILTQQLPWKKPRIQHLLSVPRLATVFSEDDNILGSTAKKTRRQLAVYNSIAHQNLTIGSGHMYTLQNLPLVMEQVLF